MKNEKTQKEEAVVKLMQDVAALLNNSEFVNKEWNGSADKVIEFTFNANLTRKSDKSKSDNYNQIYYCIDKNVLPSKKVCYYLKRIEDVVNTTIYK